jgi:hypothetical protein
MLKAKTLLMAAAALGAAAVALHLYGPEFLKEIHGGKLWPW